MYIYICNMEIDVGIHVLSYSCDVANYVLSSEIHFCEFYALPAYNRSSPSCQPEKAWFHESKLYP